MSPITTAKWTLALGTAFVFLYFGIEKVLHPLLWIGFVPGWMKGLFGLTKESWLQIIAGAEITMGVLVIIPQRLAQKTGSFLASLQLVGVLTQAGWSDAAVRDSGLLCMTTALWYLI